VPEQIRKSLAEAKAAGKAHHKLLEELAELYAERMLGKSDSTPQVITKFFPDRDAVFIKLLAQKLTAGNSSVIALLAAGSGQPTLVFAKSPGQKSNMGQLLKEAMAQLGGRGGGSADLAQGGVSAETFSVEKLDAVLQQTGASLKASS
jgi:alanyl-tRNA synthetase